MSKIIEEEIHHGVLVRAPRERVFAAMTTAEGLDGWFTTGAQIDARKGGEIYFRWQDWGPDRRTNIDNGMVMAIEPPQLFVFQWHPDNPTYATTVELKFERNDYGTIVRVREYGFHDDASGLRSMLDCAAGWGETLTLLKFYLEREK